VINTYGVWLRYELFRGRLSACEFQASEIYLVNFMRSHATAKLLAPDASGGANSPP